MRISCVILQRRWLRRSGKELGRENRTELLGVLLMKSCVAMESSPEKFTAFSRKSVRGGGRSSNRGVVPVESGTAAVRIGTGVLQGGRRFKSVLEDRFGTKLKRQDSRV